MTEELEARLKRMSRFNQVRGNKKYTKHKVYNDKIYVHNDLMYATDGRIIVYAKNMTDKTDFSFYELQGKTFRYFEAESDEVKDSKKQSREGAVYEQLLSGPVYDFEYDIDFTDIPMPYKLCSSWSSRLEDDLTFDFENNEVIFSLCGGLDSPCGVKASYGDIIKNMKGNIPGDSITISCWFIMEIMKKLKVKKLHISSNYERGYNRCEVGGYIFIFMKDYNK